jgi:hypothetical protein
MAVELAFLSLQLPSGTAQVSGTMDPPREGNKLLTKFAKPVLHRPLRPPTLSASSALRETEVGQNPVYGNNQPEFKPAR